jgi:hypothetical protein
MPPSISYPSLRASGILSRPRCWQVSSPVVCRHIASKTSKHGIPPESPAYIQVPTPPQASEAKLSPVKGILPTPRKVFDRAEGARKVQQTYFDQTTPLPTREEALHPVRKGSAEDVRRRLAVSRRDNLHSSLKGLWKRKQVVDREQRLRSREQLAARIQASKAPEREDDRLTRSTVLAATANTTAVLPDPLRFQKATESRKRTTALEVQRKEARRDALMELYINASSFIVTETELQTEVDRLFADNYWQRQGKARAHDADNAWDVWGAPPTVQGMMTDMMRTQKLAVDFHQSEHTRTVKRQKTVAEELTGGKME